MHIQPRKQSHLYLWNAHAPTDNSFQRHKIFYLILRKGHIF